MPVFEYPWLLLLLIPAGLILFAGWRRKEPSVTVPSLTPYRLAQHGHGHADWRKIIPFACFSAALILGTLALSRPCKGVETIRTDASGIDIMIVLDISGSMMAYDAPAGTGRSKTAHLINSGALKNRLATAKKEIASFIHARPNDRIGIIQFALGPDLVCPPTLDHAFLLSKLASLKPEPELLGTNTGLSAPLVEAADSIVSAKHKNAIIVLFTDGRDNVPAPLTPQEAAKNAGSLGIRIYTVGIGSDNSYAVMESLFSGGVLQPIQGDFDEPMLRVIASDSGGKYYHASDAEAMAAAMKNIDMIEKTDSGKTITIHTGEWYPVLAVLACVFLMTGMACRYVFCPTVP